MIEYLVAVVLPLFNAEKTIASTLHSIIMQTYRNIEIIVVDDGSTDSSMSIVQNIQTHESRLHYVYQPNCGAAAARNAGAALVTAPLIAFCDADDLWAPRKIELQLERMLAGGDAVGLVYCWFARIDHNDNVISIDRSGREGKLFDALLRRNVIGNGSSPLFRKTAFEAVGGFVGDFTPAEDLAIYLAVAERYETGIVPKILVGYRTSDNSLSSNGLVTYVSTVKVLQPYQMRYIKLQADISLHLRGVLTWQVIKALKKRRYVEIVRLLGHDIGVVGALFAVYLPELIGGLRAGTMKDSWKGLLRHGRHLTFSMLVEAQGERDCSQEAAEKEFVAASSQGDQLKQD